MEAASLRAPLVSVVMAARNYARYLPQAVESVFAQTFSDWELVIVDDGSTDDTPYAVRPYLRNNRVRYYRSDQLGQTRAKNLGWQISRGEFIAFLDADDAWLPTKLEKQLPLFDHPEIGVVYCRRLLMDESGKVLQRQPASPNSSFSWPRGWVLSDIVPQNFVCFSSCVLRRIVLQHVGGFDAVWDLAIDYDLWLRVAKHYQFDFVNEELVLYRTGHGNLSRKLSDRVATALSILHRAKQRGVLDELPLSILAQGHASTCRTMGYILRDSEPGTAWRWYWRALAWPDNRWGSIKGLLACVLKALSRKHSSLAPENATINR